MFNDRTDDTPEPEEAEQLAALRARWPAWVIWKGTATGSWWAMPPRGGQDLLSAGTLAQLDDMIAQAESRGDLS